MAFNPSTLDYQGFRFNRAVLLLLLLFLLINSAFLLSSSLLPFIDLPNHLAEATIFKYFGERGTVISEFYRPIPWYYPNTFHAVFCSLFPTVEIGNKIFHILCILLLQGGLFLIIRRLNGNQWYGLLGLLYVYNYNTTFGFVGFTISIPTLLFLFYFILQDFRYNKVTWKICIGLTLVILYSMHAQNALLGLLIYGIMLLVYYWPNITKAVLTGLPVSLPLVALVFVWWMYKEDSEESSTFSFLLQYYSSEFWTTYLHRLNIVAWDNFTLFQGWVGRVVATLFTLFLFVPLIYFRVWKMDLKSMLRDSDIKYPLILLLVSAGCFFVLPDRLPGQSPLYERFCTMVMLSIVLTGSVALRRVDAPWLKWFSAITIMAYTFLWGQYLYDFNRENQAFNREFFQGSAGGNSRIAGVIWDNEFRGRKVYIHFPNYFLVWGKGVASSKIIDYRFGIVRRVAPESVLPFYNEYAQEKYVDEYDYHHIEYLLAREVKVPITTKYFPSFEKINEKDGWALYRNNSKKTM